MNVVDGMVSHDAPPLCVPVRGGMLCDEPGLGKTITVLALLLRTRGLLPGESGWGWSRGWDGVGGVGVGVGGDGHVCEGRGGGGSGGGSSGGRGKGWGVSGTGARNMSGVPDNAGGDSSYVGLSAKLERIPTRTLVLEPTYP